MRNPHHSIWLGAVLISLLTVGFVAAEAHAVLIGVIALLSAITWIGVGLLETGWHPRLGARLVFVTSLLVLPTGIPGAFGARRVLDELDRNN